MKLKYAILNGGFIVDNEQHFGIENRGIKYGDGLFETMLWTGGQIRYLGYHVDRLKKSLKTLRIQDFDRFDADKIHAQALALIDKNKLDAEADYRLRLQLFRNGSGLYSPVRNDAQYFLEIDPIQPESKNKKSGLIVGLYADHFKAASSLANLKSSNALIFVLAGLFRKEAGLDEVIILNQDGLVCEAMSSNVFVYYRGTLYTPALSEGCVDGVMRRAVIEMASKLELPLVEARIDPALLLEADEIFLTNALKGIQWVMGYQNKRYFNRIAKDLQRVLD